MKRMSVICNGTMPATARDCPKQGSVTLCRALNRAPSGMQYEYKAVALGDAVAADAAGAATSVIGNVPVPTAAEGKTEPAAQESWGAAGQQAADDEGMQFLDNPAWDIPDVMFPSMGGVKDASSGSTIVWCSQSPRSPA